MYEGWGKGPRKGAHFLRTFGMQYPVKVVFFSRKSWHKSKTEIFKLYRSDLARNSNPRTPNYKEFRKFNCNLTAFNFEMNWVTLAKPSYLTWCNRWCQMFREHAWRFVTHAFWCAKFSPRRWSSCVTLIKCSNSFSSGTSQEAFEVRLSKKGWTGPWPFCSVSR